MDISSVLVSLGVDVLVVLAIVFVTELVKKFGGEKIRPWCVIIPVVLGVAFGILLHLDKGWVQVVRGGFVYGATATWVWAFGVKLLGIGRQETPPTI